MYFLYFELGVGNMPTTVFGVYPGAANQLQEQNALGDFSNYYNIDLMKEDSLNIPSSVP